MAAPRIHHSEALQPGQTVALPPAASRHVQVLRLQPGDALTLFGDPQRGGEWRATVTAMGRQTVTLQVGEHCPIEREPARAVHLAVGMPANERMDWLVEKATELGVASIQPLVTARSVLRLSGERAAKKRAHWQAVAVAACEQCGGNRVPPVYPVRPFPDWLAETASDAAMPGAFLSLRAEARPLLEWPVEAAAACRVVLGPEGGFTEGEEQALLAAAWQPVSLGARVLRTETAAVAALAVLAAGAHGHG